MYITGDSHADQLHIVHVVVGRVTAGASDGLEWPSGHNGFYFEVVTDNTVSDSIYRRQDHAVD